MAFPTHTQTHTRAHKLGLESKATKKSFALFFKTSKHKHKHEKLLLKLRILVCLYIYTYIK